MVALCGGAPWTAARGQAPDSTNTWLEWGSLAFLVRPDTAHGVQLWANALVAQKNGAEPRMFVARYDPSAVTTWAMDADLLLLPDRAGPSDPPKVLAVSPLTDLYHGKFIAARRREGSHWASRVILSFNPAGGKPLTISVDRTQAGELFRALAQGAQRSHLRDPVETSWLDDCGNAVSPSLRPEDIAVPVLRYPPSLRNRGFPGLTVVSFVVDTTGRAQMDEGFRVIFSTAPEFTQASRDAVAAARFRPAMRDGEPRPAPACHSFFFTITSNPRDMDR